MQVPFSDELPKVSRRFGVPMSKLWFNAFLATSNPRKDVRQACLKPFGNPFNIHKRDVPHSPLNPAVIRPVQSLPPGRHRETGVPAIILAGLDSPKKRHAKLKNVSAARFIINFTHAARSTGSTHSDGWLLLSGEENVLRLRCNCGVPGSSPPPK